MSTPPTASAGPAAELSTLLKFLNAAPMGMVQLSLDGRIELMNAVAARLLIPLQPGGAMDNLFTVLHAFAPDLARRVAGFEGLHGTIFEGLQLDISSHAPRPQDPQFLGLSISKLDTRRVMAVITDISHQVQTERALQRSERQLEMAMSAARIGEWELDLASGSVLRSNLDERVFGGQPRLPHESLENFLRQVHPEDLGLVSHTLQRAVSQLQDWRAEFRVVWADDSVHWVAAHGHIESVDGRAQRMLCILMETTAQRTADAEKLHNQLLESENQRVRESSHMKSQFLANMSHELRTPLNAIIGFAELLQRGIVPAGSPKQEQYLKHISSSGHHLLQLINDVLDLAKVEAGKFEFTPLPLDLPALLADVMATLQPGMQAKRLQGSVQVAPALARLHLDPVRLKQVFFNYISNAIKFTPEGGSIAVRVLEEDENHLRIEVEDDGPGISESDIGQLFLEFHQLDTTYRKEHGGTGLGLALTRKLVQAQGGSVGVRSTPGVSTVFHAVLNRRHGWDAAQLAVQHAEDQAAGPQARLLVIEPDVQQQQALILALGQAGCRVDVASTGEQALRRTTITTYHGITLDMVLPDQQGLDTLERIRQGGASRSTPVLGVSMPSEGGPPASFAIADLLCKPIRSEEVLSAIAALRLPAGRAARVLVLDHDPLARELMRVTLSSLGHAVEVHGQGEQALQSVMRAAPDALVLDLAMPGMNGFEVLAALRRLPEGRRLPVFIWTRMQLSPEDYTALAGSARAILAKGGGGVQALVEDLQHWRQAVLQ